MLRSVGIAALLPGMVLAADLVVGSGEAPGTDPFCGG